MAAPCTCPSGQHDGRFPYCSGTSGGPIVIDRLPAPGPATVSCEAIPMVVCPHGNAAASYCALCLRGRVAELEAELVVATVKGLELTKLLDPAVVWAATQLKVNADAHPGGCCVKCRAALAEVARLEALIVSWADCAPDVDRSLLDEADRIMGRE